MILNKLLLNLVKKTNDMNLTEKQINEKQCIFEFIEWVDNNGFYMNYCKGGLLWDNDRNLYSEKLYTTEELYTEYLKSK